MRYLRVVDDQRGAVRCTERREAIERREIAVHREDPFDHDQRPAELVTVGLEHGGQCVDVGVGKYADRRL